VLGCPNGENREAGVNPARSRHCDENCREALSGLNGKSSKPEDLPVSLCCLLNASRKGVQAARISGRIILSRRQPVPTRTWRSAGFLLIRLSTQTLRSIATAVSVICTLLLLACAVQKPTLTEALDVKQVTDDTGRKVTVPARIDRFISLAPNLTEIAYAVGAGDRLVGDTTFCDYPEEAKKVQKVGDTMQPSIERILALRPQLVLVSTSSQLEAFTKQLSEHQIAVYVTDPRDLEGVFRSMEDLGRLLNQEQRAQETVSQLRQRATSIEEAVKSTKPIRVFCQPLYTIGRDSFVTDLIRRAGAISVTSDVPEAWPKYSQEAAVAARPEAIILPTNGSMGSANSDVAEGLKRSPAALNGKVYKIDGDLLLRPGPRAIDGLEGLAHSLHPEAFHQ
jgi:ABC-type Fe3+-hydroxamate transport system substrate-binding protein